MRCFWRKSSAAAIYMMSLTERSAIHIAASGRIGFRLAGLTAVSGEAASCAGAAS
jgi:hypothetical protein